MSVMQLDFFAHRPFDRSAEQNEDWQVSQLSGDFVQFSTDRGRLRHKRVDDIDARKDRKKRASISGITVAFILGGWSRIGSVTGLIHVAVAEFPNSRILSP